MPNVPRGDLPTVTIATPSAWINISASIPTNLGTDKVVVTSASVGGPPQIYLGASIAASAHAAVQSNCSQANSSECQSSVEKAVRTDNALAARVAPLAIAVLALAALISAVLSYNRLEDVNAQPQLIDLQPEGYSQMIAAQASSSVVFVTASDDPSPVTFSLTTSLDGVTSATPSTSNLITSATATGSVVISTATTDGPGYFSGDSFIVVPTVDVAPMKAILTATQSGATCLAVHKTVEHRRSVDSLISWDSAVGDAVKMLPEVAPGGELQLLRTAQSLQLGPFVPALLQAAQQVVAAGRLITSLLLSGTGLIAVATIVLIIAAVVQNCLVADGNAFLIPQEAFSTTQTSSQLASSGASCPPATLQPDCVNCGGNAGSSSCSGIQSRSYLWQDCPCYDVSVFKYPPDYQNVLPAPAEPSATGQAGSVQLVCETTTGSPTTEDVTQVIENLKDLGYSKECVQHNPVGSECTTMISYGSASLSVCGPFAITTWCLQAAVWAEDIQDECLNGGRVGGRRTTIGAGTIEVIHSS